MINGIPALVSERGALPDVVGGDASAGGGGLVLPIPAWMTHDSNRLPSAAEIQPWFEAICALWDDAAAYDRIAARARAIAAERYAEHLSRRRHVEYFTSLGRGASPIQPAGATD